MSNLTKSIISSDSSGNVDIATDQDIINLISGKVLDAPRLLNDSQMLSNSEVKTTSVKSIVDYVANQIVGSLTNRGVMPVPANLTTNSTGNPYADGSSGYLNGDVFIIDTTGALTFSNGDLDVTNGEYIIFNKNVNDNNVKTTDVNVIPAIELVTSVFGRTGNVVSKLGDYTASQITNTPSVNIVSTNVQAAVNELDNLKIPKNTITSKGDLMVGAESNVPTTLNVGSDNSILVSDSTAENGLAWNSLATLSTPTANNTYGFVTIDNNGALHSINTQDFFKAGTLNSTVAGNEVFTFNTPFSSGSQIKVIVQWATQDASTGSNNIRVLNETVNGFTANRPSGVSGTQPFNYIAINKTLMD